MLQESIVGCLDIGAPDVLLHFLEIKDVDDKCRWP